MTRSKRAWQKSAKDPLQTWDPWPSSAPVCSGVHADKSCEASVIEGGSSAPGPVNDEERKALAHGRGLLAAVVRAGASRHVVATTTTALLRVLISPALGDSGVSRSAEAAASSAENLGRVSHCEDNEVTKEVEARLGAVRPALRAQVVAGRNGLPARSSSGLIIPDAQVASSVAKHNFSLPGDFEDLSIAGLRKAQRGFRHGPKSSTSPTHDDTSKPAGFYCSW